MTNLEHDLNAALEQDFPEVRQPLKVTPRVVGRDTPYGTPLPKAAQTHPGYGETDPTLAERMDEVRRNHQPNQRPPQQPYNPAAADDSRQRPDTGYIQPPPSKLDQVAASLKRADALLAQLKQLTGVIEATNAEAKRVVDTLRAAL